MDESKGWLKKKKKWLKKSGQNHFRHPVPLNHFNVSEGKLTIEERA